MQIQHDENNLRFFVQIDGKDSELTYRKESAGVVNFHGTFTPPEHRGQGIAGKITKFALDWARENNYKVIPGCPYVKTYIERHPEYQDLL